MVRIRISLRWHAHAGRFGIAIDGHGIYRWSPFVIASIAACPISRLSELELLHFTPSDYRLTATLSLRKFDFAFLQVLA
jgi:hypothetical protein